MKILLVLSAPPCSPEIDSPANHRQFRCWNLTLFNYDLISIPSPRLSVTRPSLFVLSPPLATTADFTLHCNIPTQFDASLSLTLVLSHSFLSNGIFTFSHQLCSILILFPSLPPLRRNSHHTGLHLNSQPAPLPFLYASLPALCLVFKATLSFCAISLPAQQPLGFNILYSYPFTPL